MKCSILLLLIFNLTLGIIKGQSLFVEKNEGIINPGEVVASIDTILITAEEFFYNYEFGQGFTKRQKNSKAIHLDFMINEKLLSIEGYNSGVFNKPEIKNIYYDFTSDLATEELFKDEILDKVEISDEEINDIVDQKNIELNIKWIYSSNETEIKKISKSLNDKSIFDSLFNSQLNDSTFADQRQMQTSLFNLNKKNPALASLISKMKIGEIALPINIADGWYIIKYENRTKNLFTTESELNRLKKEASEALTKFKMDKFSDKYVNQVLFESNSTIKRDGFNILRSYLGKFLLPKEKYKEWELDEKLETALNNLGISKNDEYPGIVLIESDSKNNMIDEFLFWYKNRELYIKFRKDNLKEFSLSLENIIWQMKRDKLLTGIAKEKKYFDNNWVKQQSKWWRDKIVYSALRNEYANSIKINNNETARYKDDEETLSEKMSGELSKTILHKVMELKKKYEIKINKDVLDKIMVSAEEDKRAIDFYSIKKGGLIPRPAFPTIDPDWIGWL
ncbi:MAG: hypothetical protein JEY94_02335 [Melioribacteraceae bacterium]|nr:hypothetical protein [Melioribacteraceae bacterium]